MPFQLLLAQRKVIHQIGPNIARYLHPHDKTRNSQKGKGESHMEAFSVLLFLFLCFHLFLLFYASYNADSIAFGPNPDLSPFVFMQGIKFFEPEVSNCITSFL